MFRKKFQFESETMTIKLEVAYGIIEAITDLRKGDDLEDFTVIVDGISVRCHRFILGACSLFFRALFRSGMKEDEENCVTLETVSHPTFTLILSALYTGCDIITEENVIDVWRAAHMLEIGFLVKECENFIDQNISIENFEKIYETAKLLDSRTVLKTEHKFMTQNFDLIRTSQTLLKLSFREINALIKTDELVTNSEDKVVDSILHWVSYVSPKTCEQITDSEGTHGVNVLAVQNEGQDSPVATAEHKEEESLSITNDTEDSATDKLDNENETSLEISTERTSGIENVLQDKYNEIRLQDKMTSTNEVAIQTLAPVHKETQTAVLSVAEEKQKYLLSLISISRSCLLSPEYLEKLLSNPIIVDNPAIRSIILRAVHYQLQTGHRHGQWPSAAIHRSNSQFKHVLIWNYFGNYHLSNRRRDTQIRARVFLPTLERYELTTKASSGKLTAFDNELYELNRDGLYVFRDEFWHQTIACNLSENTFMIPLGNHIYLLNGQTKEFMSVNPKSKLPVMEKHSIFPGESTITWAAKFQDRILVCSIHTSEKNEMETAVHTYDPGSQTWDRLENLQGPAENIISFHNDENTFLLQTNGNMWMVTNNDNGLIKITFSEKAWDFHWELYGAVVFRRKLIIYGGTLPEGEHVYLFAPGMDDYAGTYTVSSKICVTPIILPSRYLKAEH